MLSVLWFFHYTLQEALSISSQMAHKLTWAHSDWKENTEWGLSRQLIIVRWCDNPLPSPRMTKDSPLSPCDRVWGLPHRTPPRWQEIWMCPGWHRSAHGQHFEGLPSEMLRYGRTDVCTPAPHFPVCPTSLFNLSGLTKGLPSLVSACHSLKLISAYLRSPVTFTVLLIGKDAEKTASFHKISRSASHECTDWGKSRT